MTPARAAELLAAYGADTARWPENERADLAGLLTAAPALVADAARAARIDAALTAWARAPAAVPDGAAAGHAVGRARAALFGQRTARARWPWIGGALAASVASVAAVGMLSASLLSPAFRPAARVGAPVAAAVGAVRGGSDARAADAVLFTAMFTPTPDEEDVL